MLFLSRHILHKYANEDVSLGSWFIGLDVEHIDDRSLCCGTPPGKMLADMYLIFFVSLHYNLFFKFHILTYVYSQKEIANITSLLPLLLVNSA